MSRYLPCTNHLWSVTLITSRSWYFRCWIVTSGGWAHVCSSTGRLSTWLLHDLELQPIVILCLRSDRLLSIVIAVGGRIHIRLNHATHSCLSAYLGLNRALPVDLSNCRVRCKRRVHEHCLIRVMSQLATRSLVQVTSYRALRRIRPTWICWEVQVVTHLYLRWLCHVHHLLHHVMLIHFQILFLRFLVFCGHRHEWADL